MMLGNFFAVGVLVIASVVATTAGDVMESLPPGALLTPNPIYQAELHTTLVKKITNGSLYSVDTPDGLHLKVVHVWGDAQGMGEAQGMLLAALGYELLTKAIPEFLLANIDPIIAKLPAWLQKKIEGLPLNQIFQALLEIIYEMEVKYIDDARSEPQAEMLGLATGMCASGEIPDCNVTTLYGQIRRVNLLPELIRMSCSMFGATGPASVTGKLTQLRTLDFGDGPFANYTVVLVRHPEKGNPFVSVNFPGMVGAITGWSNKIGLSEKVWETYVDGGMQPGGYDGEPVAMVLRDLLQFADNRGDAVAFTESIKRTWAVFIGIGDFESQEFNALGYRQKDLQVFSDKNVSLITDMPYLEGLTYIDKHPQPSHDNVTLPQLLKTNYGSITGVWTAQNVPRLTQSGDLHVGVYDFGEKKAFVSIGRINAAGKYGDDDVSGKACNQPYIEFDMDALFSVSQ